MLEERGYRREAIPSLTRAYIVGVLQHEREKDGRLRMPAPPRPPSAAEDLTQLLRSRGVPEHLIPEHVARMRAAAGQKPDRRRRGK